MLKSGSVQKFSDEHDHHENGLSMTNSTLSKKLESVAYGEKSSTEQASGYSSDDFLNAIQYGARAHIVYLMDKDKSFISSTDAQGYTAMHWAAKRGDYEILENLYNGGASIDTPSFCESRMMPIHWAASDGKLISLRFLLDHRDDINVQDANGCTPIVIATQYNQINTVVYLIKHGADLTLKDTNGDSALHWAAYKGYEELVGLLLYFMPNDLESVDIFGQTPLHLAALRGHHSVVEFLITNFSADYSKRDKNGLSPLDLSINKKQLRVEWIIRRLSSRNTLDLIRKLGIKRLKDIRILTSLLFGCTEIEQANWLWRAVFWSNFIATGTSIYYATNENMADCSVLHLMNTIVQFIWWIMFTMCYIKEPAFVTEIHSKQSTDKRLNGKNGLNNHTIHSYEAALDLIASSDQTYGFNRNGNSSSASPTLPNVCHTCRVQRPLRSKHCKIGRRCVHKFDHFCPFVGNTIGRDNYKYFIGLLFMHPFAYTFFMITTVYFMYRVSISWKFAIFLLYSTVWVLLALGLLQYHLSLITTNMTTNEQINMTKYEYLRNEFNRFHNPFDKGSRWLNLIDGLFPSSKYYYNRDEALTDLYNNQEDSAENSKFLEQAKINLLV